MAKRKNKKTKKDPEEMVEEEDLDRFAGSSAEEDNDDGGGHEYDDDEGEDEDEAVAMKGPEQGYEAPADDEDSSSDSDGDTNEAAKKEDAADDSSDDEEEGSEKAVGLANAMARILGVAAKGTKGTKPMVLSKTTTRIQKQAAQEREQAHEMKEKRQHNRERGLQALHIPLSVATSNQVKDTSKALVRELETERIQRRVETRGVVALFNAIAQHQNQEAKDKEAALLSTDKKTDVKKMTKHSFLDMIKNKAAENSAATTKTTTKEKNEPNWKALQDDYMLNPKKNWDQESSDEGSEGETEQDEEKPKKKKRRIGRVK